MGKEKDPEIRRQVILELLQRRTYVSKKEIVDILENDYGIAVGRTSIVGDINYLVKKKGYPIDFDSQQQAHFFNGDVYIDHANQVYLTQQELVALLFYAKTITQYQDYPIFTDISNAIDKVIQNSAVSDQSRKLFELKNLLNTEKHHPIKGLKFIPKLLDAVVQRRTVTISYGKFGEKSKVHVLRPILLKEDKQFWYLLGYQLNEDKDITLAVDRIENVYMNRETFREIPFNYEDHFKYSFGITVSKLEPITVTLEFTKKQAEYIRILPIHQTQKIIEDTKDTFKITVVVKPSYEFYSKILSYGAGVKVISPSEMVFEFKKRLKEAYDKYQ